MTDWMKDDILAMFGVSEEQVLALDPGYLEASEQAYREREQLAEKLADRMGRIAAEYGLEFQVEEWR